MSDFFMQLEQRLHLVLHLFADGVAEYAEGCTEMDFLLVLAQLLVAHFADTLQTVFYPDQISLELLLLLLFNLDE